jgi:hypothetical protein
MRPRLNGCVSVQGVILIVDFQQKARRYRDLAREVMDERSRIEIEKLANEYEAVVAFYRLGQAKIAAGNVRDESQDS